MILLKIRRGFVSNSSSTSFILVLPERNSGLKEFISSMCKGQENKDIGGMRWGDVACIIYGMTEQASPAAVTKQIEELAYSSAVDKLINVRKEKENNDADSEDFYYWQKVRCLLASEILLELHGQFLYYLEIEDGSDFQTYMQRNGHRVLKNVRYFACENIEERSGDNLV